MFSQTSHWRDPRTYHEGCKYTKQTAQYRARRSRAKLTAFKIEEAQSVEKEKTTHVDPRAE
jgi:hypothetical protein